MSFFTSCSSRSVPAEGSRALWCCVRPLTCGDAVQWQGDVGQVWVQQEIILCPVQFEPRADQWAPGARQRARAEVCGGVKIWTQKEKKKEIEKNVINKPFLVMLLNVLQSKLKIFAHWGLKFSFK